MDSENLLLDNNYNYNYDGGNEIEDTFFTDIIGGYELNNYTADEIVNNILGGNDSESDDYENIYGGDNNLEYQENYKYLYLIDSIPIPLIKP